ncbi:MAG: A24 family peptidase [Myxococcaceae bacterium]
MITNIPFVAGALGSGVLLGHWINLLANGLGHTSRISVRSCSHCANPARGMDFVPVLPWLKGQPECVACGSPRPFREPIVSLVLGVLFAIAAVRYGFTLGFVHAALGMTLLSAVAVVDAVYWVMPFILTIPGIIVGVGASSLTGVLEWTDALLGAAIGFGACFALEVLGKHTSNGEQLGGGV